MAKRNYVRESQVRQCNKCGHDIAFAKNQTGKWFPVTLISDGRDLYFESGIGAHGNLTPYHVCRQTQQAPIVQEQSEIDIEITRLIAEGLTAEATALMTQKAMRNR